MNENQPVHFKRVQTLGRFNNILDETWDDAIFDLDVRLKTVTLKTWGNPMAEFISGAGIKEHTFIFDEDGQLNWEDLTGSVDIGAYLPYIDF